MESIRRGKITIERRLVVGATYRIEPPWGRHAARFVGRFCVLLDRDAVPWGWATHPDKVPVQFLDDGSKRAVQWYHLTRVLLGEA